MNSAVLCKKAKHRVYCRERLMHILSIMESFYDLGLTRKRLF